MAHHLPPSPGVFPFGQFISISIIKETLPGAMVLSIAASVSTGRIQYAHASHAFLPPPGPSTHTHAYILHANPTS
jgi:hypothetical protein